jgi:hypothetical protein
MFWNNGVKRRGKRAPWGVDRRQRWRPGRDFFWLLFVCLAPLVCRLPGLVWSVGYIHARMHARTHHMEPTLSGARHDGWEEAWGARWLAAGWFLVCAGRGDTNFWISIPSWFRGPAGVVVVRVFFVEEGRGFEERAGTTLPTHTVGFDCTYLLTTHKHIPSWIFGRIRWSS